MTVDIGESLALSWLRHIKFCNIVQNNWKPSRETEYNLQKSELLLNEFRNEFGPTLFSKEKVNKVIMDTEIDAIGIDANNNYYFTEVAFHEGNLGYSDNAVKIRDKIIRIILCAYGYMSLSGKVSIYFVSPNVSHIEVKRIEAQVTRIISVIQKNPVFKKCEVKLYFNERFEKNVLNPTLLTMRNIKGTSEVFIRACKLLNVVGKLNDEENKKSVSSGMLIKSKYGEIDTEEIDNIVLIKQFLLPIIDKSKRLIKFFKDKDNSRDELGLPYPLLNTAMVKDGSHNRCYSTPHYFNITKEDLYICNHITPGVKKKVIEWINKNIKSLEE